MKRTETKQLPILEKDRKWHLIDLSGQILGRAVTGIAGLLIGKTKIVYAPHTDCGDYVVAINAGKIKVTGQKLQNKKFYHHTGYPSGLRQINLGEVMESDPAKSRELLESAEKDLKEAADYYSLIEVSTNLERVQKALAGELSDTAN